MYLHQFITTFTSMIISLFICCNIFSLRCISAYFLSHHYSIGSKYAGSVQSKTRINAFNNFNIQLLSEQNKIGVKKDVIWSDSEEKFVVAGDHSMQQNPTNGSVTSNQKSVSFLSSINYFLRTCFIPSGDLSQYYFSYTYWRLGQRFISATNSVFGTQALLLALGFKKNQIGVAAATTWVLKDALGKISRILWASKNGRKFDTDAKRWRFRSSVLFAIGNALEIFCYLIPSLFLISAAVANGLKQMAMLTSSATRNAIYKSFSSTSDNIGDITAKGEAQLAVVDLLGMLLGIAISKAVNVARGKIAIMFVALSALDLFCIFQEVQSVVFNKLNFQRSYIVLDAINEYFPTDNTPLHTVNNIKLDLKPLIKPEKVAKMEKIFRNSRLGEEIFRTWTSLSINQRALQNSLDLYASTSKAINLSSDGNTATSWQNVIVFMDMRKLSGVKGIITKLRYQLFNPSAFFRKIFGETYAFVPQVILRHNATHSDIFRTLIIVSRMCYLIEASTQSASTHTTMNNDSTLYLAAKLKDDKDEFLKLIAQEAFTFESRNRLEIIGILEATGWDLSRFMYGDIKVRNEW